MIAAPVETIYDFIAEMTNMGEISPECTGGEWESETRGPGSMFIGANDDGQRTWQRRMRIVTADAPSEFAFENFGDPSLPASEADRPVAKWTYRFSPHPDGTLVEEHWELYDHPRIREFGEERMRTRQSTNQAGIEETLANLKQHFES